MPEGHSIHRYARLHQAALSGRRITASSPQGRFSDGAAVLDGRVLDGVDAVGKHLLYRFAGPETLHVHLGLFGRFSTHEIAEGDDPPAASAATRLRLRAERRSGAGGDEPTVEVHLSGPTACELLDPAGEEALRARLGPDPLDGEVDASAFAEALARRRVAIGQALLDQAVIAGVGNVFRAEALFVAGIDPARPARALSSREVTALWDTLREMLAEGERTGRIATVPALGEPSADEEPPTEDSRYVYRRGGLPCRRCASPIRSWELGGREISACPTCQPPRPPG